MLFHDLLLLPLLILFGVFELDVHDNTIVLTHMSYQQGCNDFYNDMFTKISFKLDPPHLHALQKSRFHADYPLCLSRRIILTLQPKNSVMLWPFGIRNLCLIFCHLAMAVVLPPVWTIFLSAGKEA